MRKIDLIIFDLDGTLYQLSDVVSMNYEMQVSFYSSYCGLSKENTITLFNDNDIFPVMNEKSKSATEFFAKNGIKIEEWNRYREHHFDVTKIQSSTSIKQEILLKFCTVAPIVLLSSNSYHTILHILNHLGIDKNIFDEIVCSDHSKTESRFSKINEMKAIAKEKDISCKNILSIGDRFMTDIYPILLLGGMGIVVKEPKDLENIVQDLMQGNDNKVIYKASVYN